jgi:hypothetical protein
VPCRIEDNEQRVLKQEENYRDYGKSEFRKLIRRLLYITMFRA